MMNIDCLIYPRWIIPIEPAHVVLENHVIVLNHGMILDIVPVGSENIYQAQEKIILSDHAVLPGFINTHTHSPMTLFRGMADDLKLMDWLQHYIWPSEKKWLSDEFCYDGARLAILEMIKSGTTCFNDNYFFLKSIGKACQEAQIRASLGVCALDFPTAYGNNFQDYLSKAKEIIEQFNQDELISVNIAPHAPYSVSDENFKAVKKFSEDYQLRIQIHLQESQDEINESLRQYQMRPVKRLYQLGLLSSQTQAVHMVHLDEHDFELISETQCHVVHCPESNLKLASGFSPVQQCLENKINVALGTDGAASNNDLDMLGELKIAALLAKAVSQNSSALNAFEALKMATLNGAKAMGLSEKVGSLVKNKQADMIAIDLSYPNTQPVYHPISQIVYASRADQITDVWIRGKRVLKNHQCVQLDEKEIIAKANSWKNKIRGHD
jgi:5-methylthioadenosine/S-adenosylhomocysteine deaminase